MSASVSVNGTNAFPDFLRQTEGPSLDGDDSDCPICKEPMAADAPTLEHISCKRRFDSECLLAWIHSAGPSTSEQALTCPICRTSFNIWEIEEGDRSEMFRDVRRRRITPQEYHVMGEPYKIVKVLSGRNQTSTEADLLRLARHEVMLTDDMIDILGMEDLEMNRDVFEIGNLLQRGNEFGLEEDSWGYLWTLSRLFGATLWYVAQLNCAPEVVFLVPVIPGITVHTTDYRNVLENFYSPADSTFFSSIIQIPISTEYISRHLKIRSMVNQSRQLAELKKLEEAKDVTHWVICDSVRDTHGVLQIDIVPWPRGSVFDGFLDSQYPGFTAPDVPMERNGWDEDVDHEYLENYGECEVDSFAEDMERMYVEAERGRVEAERRLAELQNSLAFGPSQVPPPESGSGGSSQSGDDDEVDGDSSTSDSEDESADDSVADDVSDVDEITERAGEDDDNQGEIVARPAWAHDTETEEDESDEGESNADTDFEANLELDNDVDDNDDHDHDNDDADDKGEDEDEEDSQLVITDPDVSDSLPTTFSQPSTSRASSEEHSNQ